MTIINIASTPATGTAQTRTTRGKDAASATISTTRMAVYPGRTCGPSGRVIADLVANSTIPRQASLAATGRSRAHATATADTTAPTARTQTIQLVDVKAIASPYPPTISAANRNQPPTSANDCPAASHTTAKPATNDPALTSHARGLQVTRVRSPTTAIASTPSENLIWNVSALSAAAPASNHEVGGRRVVRCESTTAHSAIARIQPDWLQLPMSRVTTAATGTRHTRPGRHE